MLSWEAHTNPAVDVYRALKSAFVGLTGGHRVDCYKCKSCGGYALECPKCTATLAVHGTPTEMQELSCSRCGQDFYVRR